MSKKPSGQQRSVPLRKVQSFVKKDMAALKENAKRLSQFLREAQQGPEMLSIKVCDCCIKVE